MKKNQIPTIALRAMTVLPGMIVHFDNTRKKSIAAIEKAMGNDEHVFLLTQKNKDMLDPGENDFFEHGTYCRIRQLTKVSNGLVRLMAEGEYRCLVRSLDTKGDFILAEAKRSDISGITDPEEEQAMIRVIKDQLAEYASYDIKFYKEGLSEFMSVGKLEELIIKIASDFPWNYTIRQTILDSRDYEKAYEYLVKELMSENRIIQYKRDFQTRLKESIDRNQKDYILREQLKLIQKELGNGSQTDDTSEYENKCKNLNASDEVKKKINREIERLKAMPGGGQEANVIRTYLETVLDFPWEESTADSDDIKHASKILSEDHYGLLKVKERVIEYLAVRMLNKKSKGPILCLVGPPGTGKTSIAKSVARALGKRYVRISLGGVKDEAEIRGHRKTYVGAMPGRIVEGIMQAGSKNPLMLLDEIDKVSTDYRGDTSSALLEVLDCEQNNRFRDHYIELPIDLSQVLFIATANTVSTIPSALIDRMEIIEVNSYTENEKFHIAKDFLLKKEMEANGIRPGQVIITDEAIKKIIHNYTREAGVRGLERAIGDIYRKNARKILEGGRKPVPVTEKNLNRYLGREKVSFEEGNEHDETGIAYGLAWTSVGGDTLQIEVNIMPGKGNLVLTGQLGDVMKESAQTALSCVRAVVGKYHVKEDFFEKHDIHMHIPEGAVPKDGPSAGVTMAVALFSAVTDKPVRADTAMTGEITLRGRILPVGGLKEKVLAAKMANKTAVLVPYKNRPDIALLSREITGGLKIRYIKSFADALKATMA